MSRSTSRWVSRNGARWLSANVRSSPSAVTCRVFQKPPTLLTRTSSRGGGQDLGGQPAHLGLGGHVGDEHVDRRAAVRPDVRGRLVRPPAVPAGDRDARAQCGEAGGGRLADPAGAAGDQDGPAGHRSGCVTASLLAPGGSAGDLEVEHRRAQGAHEPQPDRQQHLGAAGGAEVAEVDHVGVPDALQQVDDRLLRGRRRRPRRRRSGRRRRRDRARP